MHLSASTIIGAGLAAGHAAATGWSLDAHKYSSPANSNNQCSTEQKTGYSWDRLEPGSFSSYGSNKFSGFKCGNSFGKRDQLTKRTFQSKCITAEIDKEPKIECDGKDQMSIDSYQVSSDWDTDIDAHYDMPDGSTCKQTHRCTKGGNIVKNTQCGGAKKVTFKPKRGESGKNEKGESCNIGIHQIDFNCDKPSPPIYSVPTTSTPPPYTTSASEYTSEVESSSVISSYGSSTSEIETSSSTESSPDTTSLPAFSSLSSYANVSSTYPADSTVAIPSSYGGTTSSEVGPETSVPAYGSSSATEGVPETSVPAYESSLTSSEVVPETTAPTYEGTTSSAVSPENNSSAPVYSPTTSSNAEVPSETYEAPTPDTPELLPKCLNTWVWNTECKDNADYSCYCKNNDLVKKVMECIEAWSDDDEKTQAAAGYLQGICAPYVPENPAIITACPSGNKPAETPTSETPSSEQPEQPEETAPVYQPSSTEGSPVTSTPVEMTTSTIYSTAVSTITSCADDVKDCPAASQSTAYVTETVAVSTTVCPVSEAEKPKPSTEGSPEQSNSAPVESEAVPTQPSKPSTLTYYSTSAVTVTSCAADVTNCPASSTVVSSTEIPVSYSVIETPEASSPASPEQSAPISEAPPAPTGEAPAPYTSNVPSATGPAPTAPAVTGPSTIITYSSSVEVPATYSTGESLGMEIPSSSTYITIDTTITVPQVNFVTSTISVPGEEPTTSVGLAAGSPSDVSAYPTPTADSVGSSKQPAGSSGFGTTYVPGPTESPITPYTGGASVARTSFAGVAIGAVAAFFML